MRKYIAKRLLISVATLLVILLILFLLLNLMPGSPFNSPKLSTEQKAALLREYGLDRPVLVRYFLYLKNMLRGDFGVSYSLSPNTPITTLLRNRLPVSLMMGFCSMVVGSIAGLALGFFAAFRKGKAADVMCTVVAVLGVSIPSYLFAIALSYGLGFRAKLLPLIYDFRHPVLSGIMPVLSCSVIVMAVVAQFTRDEAAAVLESDYVEFARSQGIGGKDLFFGYVFRNSMMSVLTVMTMLLVGLLSGSMVTEDIFSVPGIGSLLNDAISQNDYNVVIALSFIYAVIYLLARLGLDVLYGILDPRVRITDTDE